MLPRFCIRPCENCGGPAHALDEAIAGVEGLAGVGGLRHVLQSAGVQMARRVL